MLTHGVSWARHRSRAVFTKTIYVSVHGGLSSLHLHHLSTSYIAVYLQLQSWSPETLVICFVSWKILFTPFSFWRDQKNKHPPQKMKKVCSPFLVLFAPNDECFTSFLWFLLMLKILTYFHFYYYYLTKRGVLLGWGGFVGGLPTKRNMKVYYFYEQSCLKWWVLWKREGS